MADATFDGSNLLIQMPSTGSFEVGRDLYSPWKEWIRLSDNAKYPKAFDTTGGDDVGGGQEIAPYFFCRNDLGWRIKMPQQDGEVVIAGNLFARSPSVALFEQMAGFDAFLRLEVSTRAVVIDTANETTQLIKKYHDNDVKFFASDGTTEVTQSDAFFMNIYDDDGTTVLKQIGFRNAADQPTTIAGATRYTKLI